ATPTPGRGVQLIHALTSDGLFHSLYVSNGAAHNPAVRFLPPNASANGLIVFGNTAYATTSNGCGGVENGLWALDLSSGQVTRWKSEGNGTAGPAVGPDGTLYVAGGAGELVAFEPKTLRKRAAYVAANREFASSPVVFEYKQRNLVAITTNDGQLHLLDAKALYRPLSSIATNASKSFGPGALATWQDAAGTRWVMAGTGSAIAAWKVLEQDGMPVLQPGWVSRDIPASATPMIVNGVVFALATGEYLTADPKLSAAQRAQRSSHAILYALDGATGKELWNSGNAMTSFVHGGGLAGGAGQVYVGTYDGTEYAFGFPVEH
ncbi:MAG: PQQ-binding-like beta-propeller repeat protein, partial [Bryobacteraceae bacterium]